MRKTGKIYVKDGREKALSARAVELLGPNSGWKLKAEKPAPLDVETGRSKAAETTPAQEEKPAIAKTEKRPYQKRKA